MLLSVEYVSFEYKRYNTVASDFCATPSGIKYYNCQYIITKSM